MTDTLSAGDLANYPIRVVVDQHGHYWRDYGDHWSMCPVSDENVATEPVFSFYREDDAASVEIGVVLRKLAGFGLDEHEPFCVPGRECTCHRLIYASIEALR